MPVRASRNRITVRDLRRSENVIGQLYPVLRDADGKVIDGFHRLDANPEWKSVTLDTVKSEEDRLIVSAHVNLGRRNISKEERANIVNRLAEIYYRQGLRPDTKVKRPAYSSRWKKEYLQPCISNDILNKITEVLNGCLSRNYIKNLLLPKYKFMKHAEIMKKVNKKRQDDTPALELIMSSHGKVLRDAYGKGIFGRLEREMIDKAKEELMNNRWFLDKVKAEIRAEVENELKSELNMMVVA